MLQTVEFQKKSLQDYAAIVGDNVIDELRTAAGQLRGARVLHINATAYGGGVAEILRTLVPLMADLGLEASWQVMVGERDFFTVTKSFHNALQGHPTGFTDEMREIYLRNNELNASLLEGEYDYIIVHDPQPAALLHFHGRTGGKHWIWRCHIDTSTPYLPVRDFLKPYLLEFDAAIFTMADYVGSGMAFPSLFIIPPSIDPLSEKNVVLTTDEARMIVGRFGIDLNRPLLVQVSRFDPWKDPLGLIDAYRIVKRQKPEVQIALIGSMATDDPEGMLYYTKTLRRAGEDFDIHVLSNWDGVNDREVNAFQTLADVVIQKSTKEGFGLVVAEALWKRKPVVGGKVGGIPLQILDGQTGFLITSNETCAGACLFLMDNRESAAEMGEKGREHVREHFLTTRNVLDYLRMFTELAGQASSQAVSLPHA
ncbi:MAG TPA: glycosyltransferase [Blastocatellia bacterium]|nr:glycosyltransferase [Blastocatellia bacterium]